MTANDLQYMRRAMELAQRGEGAVNPNPLVGALIVRGGEVLSEGWHHRYGDLHAERDAFGKADDRRIDCSGATMYVTLEPCCHYGKQPPCTDAIIEHKIARVVVGLPDPNPKVAGHGLELLRAAGIEVEILCADSAVEESELIGQLTYQNRVFLHYITMRRPWVVAKWAMTLDGKICTRTGDSRWVSGEASRQRVHRMRSSLTAILCGIGTVLADDPMLNCRLQPKTHVREGWSDNVRQPIRIVADRKARLPLDSLLVRTAHQIPTIVAYAEGADLYRLSQLGKAGVKTWCCNDPKALLKRAAEEGIDSILLEGGGTLNEVFMRQGLINEVVAFVAPKLVGGQDAKTPVEGLGVTKMAQALPLTSLRTEMVGQDIMITGLVDRGTLAE